MATVAQRLTALEAAVAQGKAADTALGTRITNEVNNRSTAVNALDTRLDVLEVDVPIIGRQAHSHGTTPPASNPLVFSNIVLSELDTDSVRISWSVAPGATGQVAYGLPPTYGDLTTLETNYLTFHSQVVSGLAADTLYHFQVLGTDAQGNAGASADGTFTTSAVVGPSATIFGPGMNMDAIGNVYVGWFGAIVSLRWTPEVSATFSAFKLMILDATYPNYGAGTGGTIRVDLQTDAAGLPSGTTLTTMTFPGQQVTPLPDIPRLFTWPSPVAVTAGTFYHLVFTNIDANPDANHVSIDCNYVNNPTFTPRQPRYPNDEFKVIRKYPGDPWGFEPDRHYTPIHDFHFTSPSHRQGFGWMQADSQSNGGLINGTLNMVREVFTVTGGPIVATGVGCRIARVSGTDPLIVRLEDSAGTVIDSASIPYSELAVATLTLGYGSTWGTADFSQPRSLANGNYRLRFSTASGTSYRAFIYLKGSQVNGYDFDERTNFGGPENHSERTTNGGTSWTAWGSSGTSDNGQWYLAL